MPRHGTKRHPTRAVKDLGHWTMEAGAFQADEAAGTPLQSTRGTQTSAGMAEGSNSGPARGDIFSPRSAAAMALSSISQHPESTTVSNQSSPRDAFEPPKPTTATKSSRKTRTVAVSVEKQKQPPVFYHHYSAAPWQTPHDPRRSMPPPHHHHHHHLHHQPYHHMQPLPPGPHPLAGAPPMQHYYPPVMHIPHPASAQSASRRTAPESFVTPTPKKVRLSPDSSTSATIPSTFVPPKDTQYSRKTKSLGVLAETFCKRFAKSQPGTEVIIDELAKELAVERRRIYDVVNILESIQIVQKKGKNTYIWMGSQHLPQMFALLQQEAIWELHEDAVQNGVVPPSPEEQVNRLRSLLPEKDFKSLSRLSQYFLQVFLVGNNCTSLPEASDKIHGETSTPHDLAKLGSKGEVPHDPKQFQQAAARGLKTKIRRLYDIANVFQAIGVLSKENDTKMGRSDQPKRPLYSWAFGISPTELLHVYEAMPEAMKEDRSPFPVKQGDQQQLEDEVFFLAENDSILANIDDDEGAAVSETNPRRVSLCNEKL